MPFRPVKCKLSKIPSIKKRRHLFLNLVYQRVNSIRGTLAKHTWFMAFQAEQLCELHRSLTTLNDEEVKTPHIFDVLNKMKQLRFQLNLMKFKNPEYLAEALEELGEPGWAAIQIEVDPGILGRLEKVGKLLEHRKNVLSLKLKRALQMVRELKAKDWALNQREKLIPVTMAEARRMGKRLPCGHVGCKPGYSPRCY